MIARTCNNVQSPDRCKGNSGPWFPRRASWGNCIPLRNAKTGWAFRLKPLAETASRNRHSDWNVFSRSSPSGKLRPGICAQNGPRFPKRDVVSRGSRNSRPLPQQNDPFSSVSNRSKRSCGGIVPVWGFNQQTGTISPQVMRDGMGLALLLLQMALQEAEG